MEAAVSTYKYVLVLLEPAQQPLRPLMEAGCHCVGIIPDKLQAGV